MFLSRLRAIHPPSPPPAVLSSPHPLHSINTCGSPILTIMKLPVLPVTSGHSTEAIVRALKKANADICAQSAVRTELIAATAYHAPDYPDIWDANIAFDILLPADSTPSQVINEIASHYTDNNAICYTWVPNDLRCDPALTELFAIEHYQCEPSLCMTLSQVRQPHNLRDDLQIIPARALRSDYRNLHRIAHIHKWGEASADQMADYQLNALDNPQIDSFVARLDKQVLAAAGIYSLGEIGIIYEVITHPDQRRLGIMKTLLSHILRHAARCQFKTITLETDPDNEPAIKLYESLGFEKLIEFPIYRNFTNINNSSTP